MRVHLVRHAKAERRQGWDTEDPLRPLSPRGLQQARAMAEEFSDDRVARIVSSPHLRCLQTVAPLAAARGLPIEKDQRLAEGEDPRKAMGLLREVGDEPVVLCSHGDVIPQILTELEDDGVDLEIEGSFRCQKGSTWLVTGKRGKPRRATYRPGPLATDDEDESPMRIAVLDLGSTSFRLVVFEATPAGRLTRQASERIMLRLGAAIALDGLIPEETCKEAVETAARLGRIAREAGATRLLPVGTAALRDAQNGKELRARIGEALETPVRLVTGEEEARLLFTAFRRRIVLPDEPCLGVDLGGGSLELAAGDAHEIHWEITLPVGVTRLHRELVKRDPMRPREARQIRKRLTEALKPHRKKLSGFEPALSIVAGGTARAFARLAEERRGLGQSSSAAVVIPVEEFGEMTDELVAATHDERLAMPGIRKNRADLLPTGGVLLTTLAETLGFDSYTVCDWGLREGVVLEAIGLD